jgi:hypothetical protein
MRHESRPSPPWITAVLALTVVCLLPARAVRADATASQGPGLYLARPAKDGHDALVKLRATMPQMKEKGLAKAMLTGGLSKPSMLATLDGAQSPLRVATASPSFYFDLTSANGGGGIEDAMRMIGGDGPPPNARNASEFVLVRFDTRGGNRELKVPTGPHARPKDSVGFAVERVGDWKFRVSPQAPLSPGEYAFYWGGNGFGGMLWDFGVDRQ